MHFDKFRVSLLNIVKLKNILYEKGYLRYRNFLYLLALPLLSSCGYNTMVQKEEAVTSQWAQVQNVYQRRSDLIPNLVNTVKGYANFEKSTLTEVIEARAKATSVNIDASKLDEKSLRHSRQHKMA